MRTFVAMSRAGALPALLVSLLTFADAGVVGRSTMRSAALGDRRITPEAVADLSARQEEKHNASAFTLEDFDPGVELPVENSTVGAADSRAVVVGSASSSALRSGEKTGGTACECVCGDRVIWRRMLFEGNVVKEKEYHCEYDICPQATVPGLRVHAKCEYIEDITTLSAGTVCHCQCGDRTVWRNAAFRGNVADKMQHRCLEEICPRVQPIPGYRFEGECRYDKFLFINRDVGSMYGPRPVHVQPTTTHAPRQSGAIRAGSCAVAVAGVAAVASLP